MKCNRYCEKQNLFEYRRKTYSVNVCFQNNCENEATHGWYCSECHGRRESLPKRNFGDRELLFCSWKNKTELWHVRKNMGGMKVTEEKEKLKEPSFSSSFTGNPFAAPSLNIVISSNIIPFYPETFAFNEYEKIFKQLDLSLSFFGKDIFPMHSAIIKHYQNLGKKAVLIDNMIHFGENLAGRRIRFSPGYLTSKLKKGEIQEFLKMLEIPYSEKDTIPTLKEKFEKENQKSFIVDTHSSTQYYFDSSFSLPSIPSPNIRPNNVDLFLLPKSQAEFSPNDKEILRKSPYLYYYNDKFMLLSQSMIPGLISVSSRLGKDTYEPSYIIHNLSFS